MNFKRLFFAAPIIALALVFAFCSKEKAPTNPDSQTQTAQNEVSDRGTPCFLISASGPAVISGVAGGFGNGITCGGPGSPFLPGQFLAGTMVLGATPQVIGASMVNGAASISNNTNDMIIVNVHAVNGVIIQKVALFPGGDCHDAQFLAANAVPACFVIY